MLNRQQILDFTRQMLREKRYDEARKLLRALPADDEQARQWLAMIEERERAEAETTAALTDEPKTKARRQGRSLREMLQLSWRETRRDMRREKRRDRLSDRRPDSEPKPEHPLEAPPMESPPSKPPRETPAAADPAPKRKPAAVSDERPATAEPDAIFAEARPDEPKIHPDQLPAGAILTRSLMLAGVIIGIILLILLFSGG